MKSSVINTILLCAALTLGCERKPSTSDVKENLIKAMTTKLQQSRPAGAPPFNFQILDVSYFRIGEFYRCDFKVKLTRPDGTDTTGIVKGKVSTDYTRVVK
jgi:hypothetical protein